MTKWHNGPKGPGKCSATKGKCPYGGAESHFDSQEEAQKKINESNEKEYGFMPTMKDENVSSTGVKLPWNKNNPNKWDNVTSYNSVGEEDGGTWTRPSADDPNKFDFFSRVASTDGRFHIISKGVIDLKNKKIKQKEVEEYYGVKKKDDPATFRTNVVSYYGGDEFDNDPVYINANRVNDVEYEIEKVYVDYDIPLDE